MELFLWATFFYLVFGLFHSVTAHEKFKTWLAGWTGPYFVEHFWRLIYCSISYLLLYYLFAAFLYIHEDFTPVVEYPLWVWNTLAYTKLIGLVVNYWAFLQLDYLEFWGIKQAYRGIVNWNKPRWEPLPLAGVQRLEVTGIYHLCRHPALAGGFLFVVSMPPLRLNLLFAFFFFLYMVIGAYFEERRLIANFGQDYLNYRKEVGAFWPNLRQLRRWLRGGWFYRPPAIS